MLQVRPGLLLGSMGDALAVFSHVPSIKKQYSVTHVLTLANEPPDCSCLDGDKGDADGERVVGEGMNGEESDSDASDGKGEKSGDSCKRNGRSRSGRGPIKTMFVRVADLPKSDLLSHFEPCIKFIKEGVERGTVLVHCEHGISRSVTVVLAYLMWSECLPLTVLFQNLKARKPEIRPNGGFMEQLKLWEAMRCRIDPNNKSYRAYRLKHMAQEMKDTGYVEDMSVGMSPDPFVKQMESTAYFRCRKCRRLLFTDESVLPHELGQGQAAFKWHKRSKPGESAVTPRTAKLSAGSSEGVEVVKQGTGDGEENQVAAPLEDLQIQSQENTNRDGDFPFVATGDISSQTGTSSSAAESGTMTEGNIAKSPSSPPPPLTPDELARVRAQVASVVALGTQPSLSPLTPKACSSYFVEPVEWMQPMLVGQVEGKLMCPKCSARLGSFNWAGEQCSCGQWVTPSFQVHKGRVDETRTLSRRKSATKT